MIPTSPCEQSIRSHWGYLAEIIIDLLKADCGTPQVKEHLFQPKESCLSEYYKWDSCSVKWAPPQLELSLDINGIRGEDLTALLPSLGSCGSQHLYAAALFHKADKSHCGKGDSLALCICKDIPRAIHIKMCYSVCIKSKVFAFALGFALNILTVYQKPNALIKVQFKASCLLFAQNPQAELEK